MRLRPPLRVGALSAIGLVLAVLSPQSGHAAAIKAVLATDYLRSPPSGGRHNLALPVGTQHSHHATSQHTKRIRHNSRRAQQYYQPARQYYQWHQN